MLLSLLLLPLFHLPQAPAQGSLLAIVPEDAYVLMHCRDVAALRARAERNDWYRMLGSAHGEPFLSGLARELRDQTHSEMDELLAMADELTGEVVFFDTGSVAGFATEPPASREALAGLMREWMPSGDAAARRTLQLAGGSVQMVAWPDEIDGWSGRAGHFAAFVDHPLALAIYSGDDSAAVVAALNEGLTSLGADPDASLVASYLASGGGQGGGTELFVDFTPLVDQAEDALKKAAEGVLPDPTSLLGLEGGTWLHVSADVFAGTGVDCRARLRLPPDSLVARLADTFKPLPATLPADLPGGIWGLYALNWDLALFYQRARAGYEDADRGEGLAVVDAGIEGARGMTGIDPVEDLLKQLAGDFAIYFIAPPDDASESSLGGMEELLMLGIHVGLVDGGAFQTVFEQLLEIGRQDSFLELEELAGVDAYVADGEGGIDGGVAILPRTLAIAPTRRVLERGLGALTRVEGASVVSGSPMQAAIDGNAGACFLLCVEMTPLRAYLLPELEGDLHLPPLDDGQPARDPFDSQLIGSVRRTPEGFEFRLHTR